MHDMRIFFDNTLVKPRDLHDHARIGVVKPASVITPTHMNWNNS